VAARCASTFGTLPDWLSSRSRRSWSLANATVASASSTLYRAARRAATAARCSFDSACSRKAISLRKEPMRAGMPARRIFSSLRRSRSVLASSSTSTSPARTSWPIASEVARMRLGIRAETG
jgi:hypothetical protein